MDPNGPYVSVAALCDAVLVEKDDERVSCIRFLDRYEVTTNNPGPFVVPLHVNCFLSFKSGAFVGTKRVMVMAKPPGSDRAILPTRQGPPERSFEAVFKGDEQGYNLIVQLRIMVDQSGLFMFDVLLDEEVVTRIPLKVTVTRILDSQNEPKSSQKT